jgi:hypothetical protein
MVGTPGRLAAITVSAQIGRNDGELAREGRGDLVPADVRLRKSVQEQERRTVATADGLNIGAAGADPSH